MVQGWGSEAALKSVRVGGTCETSGGAAVYYWWQSAWIEKESDRALRRERGRETRSRRSYEGKIRVDRRRVCSVE